jgi:hypothetical protein
MSQELSGKPLPGSQINRSHPLAKGLVGCWLMNDSGERCYDLSGYNNHGTLNGFTSPTYSLGQRSSEGIVFDGVNDYVDVGNSSSLNITSSNIFSFGAWIRTNNALSYQTIYQHGSTSPASAFLFRIQNTGKLEAFMPGQNILSGNTVLVNSVWYHVVYVRNGTGAGTSNIYINGILDTSGGVANNFVDNSENKRIGQRTTSQFFNGTIDEVRIWNRALYASEVKELYENPYDVFNFDEK